MEIDYEINTQPTMKSTTNNVIPLEFINYNTFIRVKPGSPPLISVIDMIMAVTGLDNDSAGKTFRRICNRNSDVRTKCPNFQFPGQGQRETPVTDLDTLLSILNDLNGKNAKLYREATARKLRQYFAGDQNLHTELNNNFVSQNPINQIARDTNAADPTIQRQNTQNNMQTINPFAHQMFEIEMEERRLALQEKQLKLIEMYEERLKINGQLPPTIANTFQDYTFNLFLRNQQRLIPSLTQNQAQVQAPLQTEIKPQPQTQSNMFENICLQDRVFELQKTKFTQQMLIRAGKILADLFRNKYNNQNPANEERRCGGKLIPVNVYQRKDCDLMDIAIQQTEQEFKDRTLLQQTYITRYTTQPSNSSSSMDLSS